MRIRLATPMMVVALTAATIALLPMTVSAGGVSTQGRPPSTTTIKLPPVVLESIDYLRQHSNSAVEYAFAAPAWMSPPLAPNPRTPRQTAEEFMVLNRGNLGLSQPVSAYRFESSTANCDGSETVILRQTYASIPIETAQFEIHVSNEIVDYVTARFLSDVSRLPVCQPSIVGAVKYVPGPTSSVIIVVVEHQVSQGAIQTQYDACTGQQIASVFTYFP